jgi:molybdopterin/thiamine biosynthesis adenylyltransferase
MKTIVVVGVGALGSHLVQFIRNVDAKIQVVDFDRIEQKNVQAQLHARNAVGKNKTQALGQLMQFLFGIKIETIPHKLTSDNISQILNGADLVIDCLDNASSREIIQKYVRNNNIDCLHGALAADGMFGRVIWDENFTIDSEAEAGAPTCEGGEHLPFIGIASTLMAQSVKIFLDKGEKKNYHVHPGGFVAL